MRGRQPPGPEFVERLRGSPSSKERATVILQTLSGQLRVQEAAALLGITPQRFHVLRQEAVQGLVDQLEPRPLGRPHQPPSTVSELETELARLERELVAARLREEIALVLPARPARTVSKKKNQRRR